MHASQKIPLGEIQCPFPPTAIMRIIGNACNSHHLALHSLFLIELAKWEAHHEMLCQWNMLTMNILLRSHLLGSSTLQHANSMGIHTNRIKRNHSDFFLPTRHAAVKTSRYQPYTHTQHLGTFKLPANGRLKSCMRMQPYANHDASCIIAKHSMHFRRILPMFWKRHSSLDV